MSVCTYPSHSVKFTVGIPLTSGETGGWGHLLCRTGLIENYDTNQSLVIKSLHRPGSINNNGFVLQSVSNPLSTVHTIVHGQ